METLNAKLSWKSYNDLFILAISQVGEQLFDEIAISRLLLQKEKSLKALN